jgi:hypothetical protein
VIKLLFWALLIGLFILFGATVNLGHRTLFGHIANIWRSDEAREMKQDVKQGTEPALKKGWEATKAGSKAAAQVLKSPPVDAGVPDARPAPAPHKRAKGGK